MSKPTSFCHFKRSLFSLKIAIMLSIILAILLLVHARRYMPFISDDALISLRYSQRLLQGDGLTWTEGRPVEGYSNLLWVLLLALWGGLGFDLVDGTRVLGIISTFIAIVAIVYVHIPYRIINIGPALIGGAIMIFAAPIAIWAIGGLEQPLVIALLAWALAFLLQDKTCSIKTLQKPAFCLALLAITRPDGILFAVVITLTMIGFNGINTKTRHLALALMTLPTLFYLGQLGFRLFYYGEWIPNTALVKLALSAKRVDNGWLYLTQGFLELQPISWLALLFAFWGLYDKTFRKRTLLLLMVASSWSIYLIFIGGDIFPGWRHFCVLILIMAFLMSQGVQLLQEKLKSPHFFAISMIVLLLLLTRYSYNQLTSLQNKRANAERWEWDGQVIGLMLKHGYREQQPIIAITAAGCLAYWSELPAIDMLGLNDYYLPRHPPKNFGQGSLGHELGDGAYIFHQKPDVIMFNGPKGGASDIFLSGQQLTQIPEFFRQYSLTQFEGRYPYTVKSLIWINRFSPKIGIHMTPEQVTIPSYLINGNPNSVTYLNSDNQFVTTITPNEPGLITNLPLQLAPGKWSIKTNVEQVNLTIQNSPTQQQLFQATLPATLSLTTPLTLNVVITLQPINNKPLELGQLIFNRQ